MSTFVSISTPETAQSEPAPQKKQRGGRGRVRSTPKGRRVDPKALAEVLTVLEIPRAAPIS